MDIWLFFSRHLFALKRAVLFSSRCDKTLPCFLEAPEFVFEASYDGWGHFSFHSELVCAWHLQTTAQHLRTFFLPSHPACNFSSMHDEIFCKAGDVFRKMADCHPIFHDRNAMFVAERSSIGIRLRRQLFANYRVPVDSVDVKASDNTRIY